MRILAALAATLVALAAAAARAEADAIPDGWGFGVADDAGPGTLGAPFAGLQVRTLRFMVPWNAVASPEAVARARAIVDAARERGVRQVVVSFRDDDPANDAVPPATWYAAAVQGFVQAFAGDVDAWGPANEPNCGGGWGGLTGPAGAARTAQYYQALRTVRDRFDPTALLLSPDLCDSFYGHSVKPWVDAYRVAGGGFGDVLAWHPYWGAHSRSLRSTRDLIAAVGSGPPIWVTEVGGFGKDLPRGIDEGEQSQQRQVDWIVHLLAAQPRVARVYYYSLYQSPDPAFPWDTGLIRSDQTPRPSWYTWCAATHGGLVAANPPCGDGADLVAVRAGAPVVVRRSTALGFASDAAWAGAPVAGSATLADVTGDGRADLVAAGDDGPIVVEPSTGSAFGAPEDWTDGPLRGSRGLTFADVTGDGRADAVADDDVDGIAVRPSLGLRLGAAERWTGAPFYGSRGTFFADVTGDGRADAIAVDDAGVRVARSAGNGFAAPELWTGLPFLGWRGIAFADVTGDGRADAIAVDDFGIVVRRSTGHDFAPPEYWSGGPSGASAPQFADVTGDGLADAVAVAADGDLAVRRSSGNGFGPAERWAAPPPGRLLFGDVTRSSAFLGTS
jgi:FG-GAP-like repeat/Glycosyl hydrolase catalytic core